jgi:hypothetical protein
VYGNESRYPATGGHPAPRQLHALPPAAAAVGRALLQKTEAAMPGKRVQFDDETWRALDLLARDNMKTFQELHRRHAHRSGDRYAAALNVAHAAPPEGRV